MSSQRYLLAIPSLYDLLIYHICNIDVMYFIISIWTHSMKIPTHEEKISLLSPSTWFSLCFEPSTGSYQTSPSHWSWRSRGSVTWPSKRWLKTRRPCWWVEAEGPQLPLPPRAPPAQVSRTWDTHTHSQNPMQHTFVYKTRCSNLGFMARASRVLVQQVSTNVLMWGRLEALTF